MSDQIPKKRKKDALSFLKEKSKLKRQLKEKEKKEKEEIEKNKEEKKEEDEDKFEQATQACVQDEKEEEEKEEDSDEILANATPSLSSLPPSPPIDSSFIVAPTPKAKIILRGSPTITPIETTNKNKANHKEKKEKNDSCIFCGKNLKKLQNWEKKVHTNDCMKKKNSSETENSTTEMSENSILIEEKPTKIEKEKKGKKEEVKEKGSSQECPSCKRGLQHLDQERKQQHINECLDQFTSLHKTTFTKNLASGNNRLNSDSYFCLICKSDLSQFSLMKRLDHFQKCSKKNNLSRQQYKSLKSKRISEAKEEQKKIHKDTSSLNEILKAKHHSLSNSSSKKKINRSNKESPFDNQIETPKSKEQEELMLALALSNSINESSVNQQKHQTNTIENTPIYEKANSKHKNLAGFPKSPLENKTKTITKKLFEENSQSDEDRNNFSTPVSFVNSSNQKLVKSKNSSQSFSIWKLATNLKSKMVGIYNDDDEQLLSIKKEVPHLFDINKPKQILVEKNNNKSQNMNVSQGNPLLITSSLENSKGGDSISINLETTYISSVENIIKSYKTKCENLEKELEYTIKKAKRKYFSQVGMLTLEKEQKLTELATQFNISSVSSNIVESQFLGNNNNISNTSQNSQKNGININNNSSHFNSINNSSSSAQTPTKILGRNLNLLKPSLPTKNCSPNPSKLVALKKLNNLKPSKTPIKNILVTKKTVSNNPQIKNNTNTLLNSNNNTPLTPSLSNSLNNTFPPQIKNLNNSVLAPSPSLPKSNFNPPSDPTKLNTPNSLKPNNTVTESTKQPSKENDSNSNQNNDSDIIKEKNKEDVNNLSNNNTQNTLNTQTLSSGETLTNLFSSSNTKQNSQILTQSQTFNENEKGSQSNINTTTIPPLLNKNNTNINTIPTKNVSRPTTKMNNSFIPPKNKPSSIKPLKKALPLKNKSASALPPSEKDNQTSTKNSQVSSSTVNPPITTTKENENKNTSIDPNDTNNSSHNISNEKTISPLPSVLQTKQKDETNPPIKEKNGNDEKISPKLINLDESSIVVDPFEFPFRKKDLPTKKVLISPLSPLSPLSPNETNENEKNESLQCDKEDLPKQKEIQEQNETIGDLPTTHDLTNQNNQTNNDISFDLPSIIDKQKAPSTPFTPSTPSIVILNDPPLLYTATTKTRKEETREEEKEKSETMESLSPILPLNSNFHSTTGFFSGNTFYSSPFQTEKNNNDLSFQDDEAGNENGLNSNRFASSDPTNSLLKPQKKKPLQLKEFEQVRSKKIDRSLFEFMDENSVSSSQKQQNNLSPSNLLLQDSTDKNNNNQNVNESVEIAPKNSQKVMPDYDKMDLKTLKEEANLYGIKMKSKASLIKKMKEIWCYINQNFLSDSLVNAKQIQQISFSNDSLILHNKRSLSQPGDDNRGDNIGDDGDLARSSPKKKKKTKDSQKNKKSKEETIFDFLKSSDHYLSLIYTYQPFDLLSLQSDLKSIGCNCGLEFLSSYLDQKAIVHLKPGWKKNGPPKDK